MNKDDTPLKLDPESAYHEIAVFIKTQFEASKRDAVLIGLSGGLDSAVVAYLCVKSLGKDFVRLLNLPERDSKSRHQEDARLIAKDLDIKLERISLSPALRALGIYRSLPLKYVPGRRLKSWLVRFARSRIDFGEHDDILDSRLHPKANSFIARGNAYASAKHRMRMVMLYHLADSQNLLVVGAANRTEYLTGTFSKWGCDQCADIMPILHLYRSQLPGLAIYLGIPEAIRNKPADPDVLPGLESKEVLLGSFERIDLILWNLEQGTEIEQIRQRYGPDDTDRAIRLLESSRPMREVPYHLER